MEFLFTRLYLIMLFWLSAHKKIHHSKSILLFDYIEYLDRETTHRYLENEYFVHKNYMVLNRVLFILSCPQYTQL